MDALKKMNIAYDICPGVSAFCGTASALELEYTLPGVSQTVIISRTAGRTPVPERESIPQLARHQATMVLFLSTGHLPKLQKELIEGGYTAATPAAICYKATWPEEKRFFCTVGTLAETAERENITSTALIVVAISSENSMIGPFCMTLRLRRHFEKQQKPRTDLIQIKPVWINNSMKTAVISFTQNGNACNRRIITGLKMAGYTTEGFYGGRYKENDSLAKEILRPAAKKGS